jgi:signal transduction histidine kinase
MIGFMATALPLSRRDLMLAVGLSCLGVLLMLIDRGDPGVNPSIVAVPAFVAVTVPVAWRSRAPIGALAALLAALLAHAALFGVLTRCGVVLPAMLILVFAAATWTSFRPALLGLALALAVVLAVSLTDQRVDLAAAPPIGALTVALWGIGRLTRSRRAIADTLDTQTRELRRARDERARLEVTTDRARLSIDLDRLLQRRLVALAELTSPGPRDEVPDAARARLVEIERESRRTLEEMRAVVGVLRDDNADAPVSPQPTLTHIEAMLLRTKGSGARLIVEGSPRVLPVGVELSAFRIVEHLLDGLADAPGVDVRVSFEGSALRLTVCGASRRGSRAAIDRARERARLHRGTLEAIVGDGRVRAVARLPVAAA